MEKTQLKQIIREIIVKEIGEGSSKPYAYSLDKTVRGSSLHWIDYTYNFEMDDHPDYIGKILLSHFSMNNSKDVLSIDFDVKPKDMNEPNYEATNLGLKTMFRIMSTVIAVLKNDLSNIIERPVSRLVISAVNTKASYLQGDGNAQRLKLYDSYIKKHVKIKSINDSGLSVEYELEEPILPKN